MARHNLGTVVSFEVTRTLTKRRFWIATLSVPVLLGVVIALVTLSNSSTSASVDAQSNQEFSFSYSDASGYVDPAVARDFGGTEAINPDKSVADVKAGTIDAYFAYPADPTTQPTRVYGVDKGIFNNGMYDSVATQILVTSSRAAIGDPKLSALVQGDLPTEVVAYDAKGQVAGGIGAVIPPLMFLVVFYVVMVLLANQMLNSTLEEKENRVTEMILTTLDPTTLIMGKVISLFIIQTVQIIGFTLPVLLGYLVFRNSLNLPNIDLSILIFNPGQIIVAALLLVGGFTLFTGTLVAIGAIMPSAKEAGQIFGAMMALIFVPFYTVTLIVSDPHAAIVQVFTYFPYSAPPTAMLRNGFNSLNPIESIVVIAELFVLGAIVLHLAVRLFRLGSIEYTRKVSLRRLFSSRTRA